MRRSRKTEPTGCLWMIVQGYLARARASYEAKRAEEVLLMAYAVAEQDALLDARAAWAVKQA